MAETVDYYKTLGLPHGCSASEIRQRYHELVRKYHPDVAADKEAAGRIFAEINEAYRILQDADRRARLDRNLAATPKPQVATRPLSPRPPQEPVKSSPGQSPIEEPKRRPQAVDPMEARAQMPGWNWKVTCPPPTTSDSYYSAQISTPDLGNSDQDAKINFTEGTLLSNSSQPRSAVSDAIGQVRIAIRMQMWVDAEALCTRLCVDHPETAVGFELLGDILARDGRLRRAVACYRAALGLDPENELIAAKIDCLRIAIHHPDQEGGPTSRPDTTPPPVNRPSVQPEPAPEPKHGTFNWVRDMFAR
ncbi:MAG TPA: DnaJ domain-containing protein [Capsulimonadaceae bacterium]|jgi:hypothetical protein